MATKTVADKLLIKPGTSVWASDGDRLGLLGELPVGVTIVDSPGTASTALVFADDAAMLRSQVTMHREHLAQSANLWIAYPKANKTDINRDSVWPILTDFGFRPISQVAVDDTWSALRFRPLREGEPAFTGGR